MRKFLIQLDNITFLSKLFFIFYLLLAILNAQFIDEFEDSLIIDPDALNGWTHFSGDGNVSMKFTKRNGYATIYVDATQDKRGIWWALIRRCVSKNMDLSLIPKPNYEFRIEAKIRVSSAPKRVNLHLNTQRTTDFHSNLMEFDIPDTTNWHVISMTTKNFDARPGDYVYGQMALMDWGFEKYRVDIDYFKVDIVRTDTVSPDKGRQVVYHPSIPDLKSFSYKIPVTKDALVNVEYPLINFNSWTSFTSKTPMPILTVYSNQYAILYWDLSRFKGKKVDGIGVIEIKTHSVQKLSDNIKDFGLLRVMEIYNTPTDWDEKSLTSEILFSNGEKEDIINPQMIIDISPNTKNKGKTLITINKWVLQRMIDGKTTGIAIKSLGEIIYSFYPHEYKNGKYNAYLYFNLEK